MKTKVSYVSLDYPLYEKIDLNMVICWAAKWKIKFFKASIEQSHLKTNLSSHFFEEIFHNFRQLKLTVHPLKELLSNAFLPHKGH